MSTPDRSLMTAEEFARFDDEDRPCELVRGRVVWGRFRSFKSGAVCSNVAMAVANFDPDETVGKVLLAHGVITARRPDTVRVVHIGYYLNDTLPADLPDDGFLDIVPELVFEVLTMTDTNPNTVAKVDDLLSAGSRVVCVVDPGWNTIVCYRSNDLPVMFDAADQFTFPDILPGFAVPVARLFESSAPLPPQ